MPKKLTLKKLFEYKPAKNAFNKLVKAKVNRKLLKIGYAL